MKEITNAQSQISNRKELVSPPKMVAELTLVFWVRLFNAEFERILWKDLRRAFPYLPKNQKHRKQVSAPLNDFRNLRNRIFHNEPVCWNFERLQQLHEDMIQLLGWLNRDLPAWIQPIDRFDAVLLETKTKLT